MKDFKTAAKQRNAPETITFKVDGVEITSRRPTEDQIVFLMAAEASDIRTGSSKMAAVIDFGLSIFDAESSQYLGSRLLDPEDDFSFVAPEVNAGEEEPASFMGIISDLIEEWSNRPTKPFSDSTTSQGNGGASSTGTVIDVESTSSDSIQLVPAT